VIVEDPSAMPITPPGFSTRRISLRAAITPDLGRANLGRANLK
jgi:hypothetical protein